MNEQPRSVISIVHVVRDIKETFIVSILRDEKDAIEMCRINPRYSYESWCIEGETETENIKFSFEYTKKPIYPIDSFVFYLNDGVYKIAKIFECDNDQEYGFDNVLYAARDDHDKIVWLLGSDILGEIIDYEKRGSTFRF